MSGLAIDYELEGTGWARMVFTLGESQLVFDELSYLDEPLRELLIAGLFAAFRRLPSTIIFDNEGAGLSRLAFEHAGRDWPPEPMALKLVRCTSAFGDDTWSPLTTLTTDSEQFAKAVLLCADTVRNRYGLEEYGNQWAAEGFPVRATEALRHALSVRDPLGSKYREDGTVTAPS